MARKAGFDNINADIIYALPGQSVQQHIDTVKKLIALGPEHISMYALILEDGTPLARAVKRGETQLPNEDETIEMAKHAQALLEQAGYFRYEISNYAKAGRTSHHNINYWENGEYIGVGLGAHSAFRDGNAWLRRENTASMDDYIMNAVNSFTVDRIEYEEELFESVMLGLRMTRGIDRKRFEHRFGTDIVKKFQTSVSNLGKNGLLEVDDSAVRLTEKGLDVQNSVLMAFMEYTK
ncbi:Oxygen-independent coproporphyrinogen-III oxidase-like protein YqeR [bioreactor metagenome]|uniref:Oxygen-independent coproporphyrinogen-III oxidase-like protein YqeR n=1 Tax=bioreactor metagenome TaxID=1076179 RepID=A0A645DQR0_9ZZZZ